MRSLIVPCLWALLVVGPAVVSAAPEDQDFFVDFQGLDAEDPMSFSIDGVPAAFTGGDAFFTGVGELYFGDNRAWAINPGETHRVDFDVPMRRVEVYAVGLDGATLTAVGSGVSNPARDATGSDISDPSQLFVFTGEIDAIVLANTSMNAAAGFDAGASIDNLGFSPVNLVERCAFDQKKAVANYCRSYARCEIRLARTPMRDPMLENFANCTDRAESMLRTAYDRAQERAANGGATCLLDELFDDVFASVFRDPLDSVYDDARVNFDPDTALRVERRLRGSLIFQASLMCRAELRAEANLEGQRLTNRRDAARDRFDFRTQRRIRQAGRKGFEEPSIDLEGMGDGVSGFADDVAQAADEGL